MKKRFLPLLLAVLTLLVTTSLTGCEGKSDAQAKNTITLLTKGDDNPTYIQRIIALYEEKTGNHIEVNIIETPEFEKKATEIFERGDIPDILIHFNDANLAHFNVPDNFYYMNDEPWVDELTEGAKAYCLDSEGNLLGLPFWENSLSGCYYNKTLLDELGLKPASTQTEFDALCRALKSVGHTPMYWAASGCNWMFQFGLDPIFADDPELLKRLNKNEITYADIPKVADMVEWLDEANRQGWFNSDYEESKSEDLASAVANGEIATIFIWDTWFTTDLKEGGKYSAEDFALMPVFMNTEETGTYEGGNMGMIMANKNSERLELILDFLSFCATPENYNVAFEGIATVNCFKNQTTIIQSDMVSNARASIEAHQRVSTAWPKILGYKQEDVGAAVLKMFRGEVDVAGCVKLMDEYRIAAARELGAEGF